MAGFFFRGVGCEPAYYFQEKTVHTTLIIATRRPRQHDGCMDTGTMYPLIDICTTEHRFIKETPHSRFHSGIAAVRGGQVQGSAVSTMSCVIIIIIIMTTTPIHPPSFTSASCFSASEVVRAHTFACKVVFRQPLLAVKTSPGIQPGVCIVKE